MDFVNCFLNASATSCSLRSFLFTIVAHKFALHSYFLAPFCSIIIAEVLRATQSYIAPVWISLGINGATTNWIRWLASASFSSRDDGLNQYKVQKGEDTKCEKRRGIHCAAERVLLILKEIGMGYWMSRWKKCLSKYVVPHPYIPHWDRIADRSARGKLLHVRSGILHSISLYWWFFWIVRAPYQLEALILRQAQLGVPAASP